MVMGFRSCSVGAYYGPLIGGGISNIGGNTKTMFHTQILEGLNPHL